MVEAINEEGAVITKHQFHRIGRNISMFNEYQQIISSISHELRTPAAILKSNIQLLNSHSDISDDLRKESISLCDAAVADLVHFLDTIQLVNLALKNRIKSACSFFNVREITSELYTELENQNLNYERISINWDIEINVISSDLKFLCQIINHLCSNALRFSRDKVVLHIFTNINQLVITVNDSGIGIPEADIEKVFYPFYRAENAVRIPGCGLGLSIVKSLTDCLGGDIYLSSMIGQGTTIKIILPYEFSQ